jgi:hypothetical protein
MSDEEVHECVLSGKTPLFHLPELLPLLLLGITDDCFDIATSTYDKLEGIGEIYKRFIDHLDTRVTQVCVGVTWSMQIHYANRLGITYFCRS